MTTVTQDSAAGQAESPPAQRGGQNVRWGRDHRLPARTLIFTVLVLLALSAVYPLSFMAQAAFRTQAQRNRSETTFPTSLSLGTFLVRGIVTGAVR